jgi:AcrR family transcriptional regulator
MDSRQPDQTRQRILASAYAEIHKHGYQAASIANILAATGLTKGALYHHFPDKKTLGLAVIEEVIRPFFDNAFFAPLRNSRKPLTSLRKHLRSQRDLACESTLLLGCPVNNLMQEMSPLDDDFRVALNRLVEDWREIVAEALSRAQAQGEIHAKAKPLEAALFIVASLWGCMGVAKNLQSVDAYHVCLKQLAGYVDSLAASAG